MHAQPNRIAGLSEASGLTRMDVAHHLGVDLLTVARYEAREPIPAGHVFALADLFAVSVVWLMGREREAPSKAAA